MLELDNLVSTIDDILITSRRRHIVGGVLVSLAMLFAGLAITTMTIKEDADERQDY